MTNEEPILEEPARDPTRWHRVHELLQTAQYESAAALLLETQQESQDKGQAILADILAAAYDICLACGQCKAEITWFERAHEEAGRREHELKQQLYDILKLVSKSHTFAGEEQPTTPPAVPEVASKLSKPDHPPSVGHLSLWQQARSLLGRRSERPAGLVEAAPVIEEAGTPAALTVEGVGEPTPLPVEEAEAAAGLPTEKTMEAASNAEQVERALPSPLEDEAQGLPALVVYCLGPFRVYQNDQLIPEWSSLKGQSIFKYLLLHKERPVAKDILMDVFWPDVEPEDTRRNLHQAIYSLRQTLRHGQPDLQPILFKKDCYLLNPEIATWLDFEEFEKHVQAGRHLQAGGQITAGMAKYSIAEALYQGDFLEEELYEDWPGLQREYLRNLYLDTADRLSHYYMQQGEFTASIALCQKILAKDNCYEEAYRRLMECFLAQGQRYLAIRYYHSCVQALREELDLAPAEETVALYRQVTTTR